MDNESYWYYLQILKLPRNASEKEIRASIFKQHRILTKQVNSSNIDLRHEAERQTDLLKRADKVLLGPEGQIIRQNQQNQVNQDIEQKHELAVDAESIARAIERFAISAGRKIQERQGTAVYKRAAIFYKGIEYLFEELVHKAYQANLDKKRCKAIQEGIILFEWHSEFTGVSIETHTKIYLPGRWVEDVITASAKID